MPALRFLNLAIVSVLVGSAALVCAQEEKQQEEKPARQEEAKPQPKQEEARPSRQEEAKPSKQEQQMQKQDEKRGQEQSHQQATPDRQERPETQNERPAQGQGRQEVQGDRAPRGQEHPQTEGDHAGQGQGRPQQRAENGRPAGRGGHIPDDKFRSHFGREHHFQARTVIVSGRPQFLYGGYSFELVDAWPVDWAYTDDVYVDYIDGDYFLFDLLHPGVRVAVFVVM